jgi:hypothetical protein
VGIGLSSQKNRDFEKILREILPAPASIIQRIAKNTIMLVRLYMVRVVLNTLGVEDCGKT